MTSDRVLVRLLGPFQILKFGQPVSVRPGGKTEQLLSYLAMHPRYGVPRATIVEQIWPDVPAPLAGQSLNTLMYSLKSQLSDALAGQPPIVHRHTHYSLNLSGGVQVDVVEFESATRAGNRLLSEGSTQAAINAYEHAVTLYAGDLAAGSDVSELLERERLRAACLTTLARLADAHFELANYDQARLTADRLLAVDPCREDAHRMVMRAYVRSGARAQALRQYKLCALILRDEYDAAPEPATTSLFDLVRTDPGAV